MNGALATALKLALAALIVATALVALTLDRLAPPDPHDRQEVTFEVLPGQGAGEVADALAAAGLVKDALSMRIWLRLSGLDRRIGEGLYELSPALGVQRVAQRLAQGGRPRTVRLTVPEGWRARDVARRVANLGLAEEAAFLQRIGNPGELAPAGLPEGLPLEGYLYPDTYELRHDAGADATIAAMITRFEQRVGPLGSEAEAQGLGLHELVTLASMVQAEAGTEREMPIIAGVFRNRLDVGMMLQSDPTVAYGLQKDLQQLDFPAGDFGVDHPWNTYTRSGLPEGPIANAGSAAYRAVLTPERTAPDGRAWMYFLHGRDANGDIVFRPNATFDEHQEDVVRYLR